MESKPWKKYAISDAAVLKARRFWSKETGEPLSEVPWTVALVEMKPKLTAAQIAYGVALEPYAKECLRKAKEKGDGK